MPDTPSREKALAAVQTLLAYIGEDVTREGLENTPSRVLKAWEDDWGLGYTQHPPKLTTFTEELLHPHAEPGATTSYYAPMVLIKKIHFHSHCEHHMAPFYGTAHVAYIPDKSVVGLSKLARVVHYFARRLQVQERLTNQVADYLQNELQCRGTAVRMTAVHTCMLTRGVCEPEAVTVTQALRGVFYHNADPRNEFLQLCATRD